MAKSLTQSRKRRDKRKLDAMLNALPESLELSGDCEIQAATSEDNKLPTVDVVLYTGAKVNLGGFYHPVVVDIEGIDTTKKSRPILLDHDTSQIVGHTTKVLKEGQGKRQVVRVQGVLSAAGDGGPADEVIRLSKAGYPWQASIGASGVSRPQFVPSGETIRANGRLHEGPLFYFAKTRLREATITALGADDDTSASISAKSNGGEDYMPTFSDWLKAQDVDEDSLTPRLKAAYQAEYNEEFEIEASDSGDGERSVPKGQGQETRGERLDRDIAAGADDVVTRAAKDYAYIAEIEAICGDNKQILATALKDRLPVATVKVLVENAALKASRQDTAGSGGFDSFNVVVKAGRDDSNTLALDAALSLSCGVTPEALLNPYGSLNASQRHAVRSEFIRPVDEKTLDLAMTHYKNLGIRDALHILARNQGYTGVWGSGRDAIKAAFTSLALPNVFGPVVERKLIQHYQDQDRSWQQLVKVGSVRDFRRTTSGFKIYGTGYWERITGDGELPHGQLKEAGGYSNKAETYGQMNMLTRQDIINDDLGVLNGIAEMMTYYAMLMPEIETMRTIVNLQANNVVSAGNGNLLTGGGTAFDLEALEDLYETFKNHKDADAQLPKDAGKPQPKIKVTPKILLLPSELELKAEKLLSQEFLAVGGSESTDGLISNRNVMYGKFNRVYSPWLSDTAISANASATAYYLFADPNVIPAVEIVYLNGVQRPTIESIEPRPEVLGMGFRGYMDFGVESQDPLGVAKATGA